MHPNASVLRDTHKQEKESDIPPVYLAVLNVKRVWIAK